ncbi:MAG TPA: ABC transporter permease [Terriglobia bacterium]|nr:ABC transporter permease [Terriglobia bacterium]
MSWVRVLVARCSVLFRRKRLEETLDEELRVHLEMLRDDYLKRGLSPEEARYAAHRTFGGLEQVKEEYREQRGVFTVETLLQDVRYGLRQLRRNPGFALVAGLTLALGIGANTAIFSVVNAVVLRPLPYPHSDRLVWIAEVIPALKAELASGGDYVDWKDQNHTLQRLAAYDESADFNLTGRGTPARVHGAYVTANFFATLGVDPQIGRGFTAQEDQPNGPHVAVLMHSYWQQYFGSDPHMLGQTINLDNVPYTVIGVMPASFRFPGDSEAQLLVPLALNAAEQRLRSGIQRLVRIVGRLKPGVSLAAARSDLDEIRKRAEASGFGGPMRVSTGGPGPAPGGEPGPNLAPPRGSTFRIATSGPPPSPNASDNVVFPPGSAPGNASSAASAGPPLVERTAPVQRSGRAPRNLQPGAAPPARPGSVGPTAAGQNRQISAGPGRPAGGPPPGDLKGPPPSELKVVPLAEHLAGNLRPAMLTLLGVVGLVLLIACANVANLMLTRASARSREVAVRAVLGAGRWRLVRQLLAESVILSLVGGLAGLLLAAWGVAVMTRFIPSDVGGGILSVAHPHVDGTVLIFVLAVSVLTGVLFGLAPAIAVTRSDLAESLKEAAPVASAGFRRGWLRSALAVVEISLALVLLIGAGLLIKSFYRVLSVDPGFAPERVLTLNLSLTDASFPTAQQKTQFFSEVLRRVEALPGVRSVGLCDSLPLSPYRVRLMMSLERLTGRATLSRSQTVMMSRITVSPGYFYTLGIPVLEGRTFTDHDDEHAQKVAVVNETLARHLWAGEDPRSQQIPLMGGMLTVVGVVGNTRHEGLSQDIEGEIYVPYLQQSDPGSNVAGTSSGDSMQLAVRTASDPTSLVSAVRAQVMAVDSAVPIYHVGTMEQTLSDSLAPRRFNMLLLGIFAGIALALATVGIYGVMAFSVTQRTHEIGIRMALGAERSNVLGLIVKQGLGLTLAGIIIGVGGALALTRFLSSFLYGVCTTDVATFALVSVVLLLVSILASYIPARRATKVDPMVALRCE